MYEMIKDSKRKLIPLLLALGLIGCGGGSSDSGSSSLPDQAGSSRKVLLLG